MGNLNRILDPLTKQHTSTYLGRLQDLRLVIRITPATIREGRLTTQGRYDLRNACLRFYFRFTAPHERLLEQGLIPRSWEIIQEQLRAFVGGTAFEALCREWVARNDTEEYGTCRALSKSWSIVYSSCCGSGMAAVACRLKCLSRQSGRVCSQEKQNGTVNPRFRLIAGVLRRADGTLPQGA